MSARGWQVFAVDPGETTGWAWACVGVNEHRADAATGGVRAAKRHRSGALGADTRVAWGEVPRRQRNPVSGEPVPMWEMENIQAQDIVIEMIRCQAMGSRASAGVVPEISTVCIEDFILREWTQDRSLLSPVRVGAKVEYSMAVSGVIKADVHLQSSSDAKRTVTDERLKRWGFWVEGQPHARDALRHLLLFMREVGAQT